MSFTDAIQMCFRKYVTFSGRATRSEFWNFVLFLLLGSIIAVVLNSLIFGPEIVLRYKADANGQPIGDPIGKTIQYNGGIFGTIFGLACLLPWLSVSWRRMHDIGKAGYWPFLLLLFWILAIFVTIALVKGPSEMISNLSETGETKASIGIYDAFFFIGYIAILITNIRWLSRPSQPGSNRYGPGPQEVSS
jgi:uncharacterized membrane protein YhaH (DUF805 family)